MKEFSTAATLSYTHETGTLEGQVIIFFRKDDTYSSCVLEVTDILTPCGYFRYKDLRPDNQSRVDNAVEKAYSVERIKEKIRKESNGIAREAYELSCHEMYSDFAGAATY